jgi:hypothetical protein
MPYTPPCETLATTSTWPNTEALAMHLVLAHPRAVFHPCTCGLRGGAAVVVAVLNSYHDVEATTGMTTRRRWSWTTTSSTPTHDYIGLLLQLFFCCSACLVVTIHDLILTSILGWRGSSSTSVAYPYPINGIRAILHSSWSVSCTMVIHDGY